MIKSRKTKILQGDSSADVAKAGKLLKSGGLVALPTETVYGLAARADNKQAVESIFRAKGRPSDHPLIVHIASGNQLSNWACEIPEIAYVLAKHFWPGPLTLLLKKAAWVDDVVTGGKNTIGLRVPDHEVFAKILEVTGLAFAAPSANPYKQLSPVSSQQVLSTLAGKVDAVLDGGECKVGLESTILDLSKKPYSILRSGPISLAALQEILGEDVRYLSDHNVKVPGNVADHYMPITPLFLVSAEEMLAYLNAHDDAVACLFFEATGVSSNKRGHIKMPGQKTEFARVLYKTLHQVDQLGYDKIVCQRPPMNAEWADVRDRLGKAASHP